MKNKILIVGILTTTFIFVSNVCAVGQNGNNDQGQGSGQGLQEKEAVALINEEKKGNNVANAIKEMLYLADRNSGIGQQVKTIAQTQVQNQEKLETSLQKVQSRGGLVKFFVGPNYSAINDVKNMLEQNKEQIKQLNQVKNQLTNQNDMQSLVQQIQILEQANFEIEDSLGMGQKGFSLFGWMFRMFSH